MTTNDDAIQDTGAQAYAAKGLVSVTVDGKTHKFGPSFFRGESSNFGPNMEDLRKPDGTRKYIMHGWRPDAPIIATDTRVLVAGGAFAESLAEHLRARGITATEALVVPGGDAVAVAGRVEGALDQGAVADVLVVVPDAAPLSGEAQGDSAASLADLVARIQATAPGTPVILAVSPDRGATGTDGALEAEVARTTAAKSALRCAIDEIVCGQAGVRPLYFPLIEIVANVMRYPFGIDGSTLAPALRDLVFSAFDWAFTDTAATDADLDAAHEATIAEDNAVAAAAAAMVEGGVTPEGGLIAADSLATRYLAGFTPDEPFIDGDTTIIAFGSCFANNISKYLNNLGFNVATKRDTRAYVSSMGDGIVNTYAIRQQFEWAWLNRQPSVDLWHGYKAEEFGYDERVRLATKELFDQGDVFIITLGLSEIWYDEPTGEVFWRWVPKDRYDPSRHKFRVATHAQNLENLRAIYDLIRSHRPEARIIFTVSPIPLKATFRDVSCMTANAVSKSTLRSAFDEFYRERRPQDDKLFYFPSYEIVLDSLHFPLSSDYRHPGVHAQWLNMKAFERHFCRTGMTDADLANEYIEASVADFRLGGPEKSEALKGIREKGAVLLADNKDARVQSVTRAKVKESVEREREEKATQRTEAAQARTRDAAARREGAAAEREAAAEERRRAAEERRQAAEARRNEAQAARATRGGGSSD